MRKKPVFLLFMSAFLVFAGLFSCSEFILPKNVEVEGTLDFPVRIGTSNWGIALATALEKALAGNANTDDINLDFDIKVYDVNYGQDEQTLLAYIHSEMSNPLNPDDYFKEVADLVKKATEEPYAITLGEKELHTVVLKEISLPPVGGLTIPYADVLPGGVVSPVPITVDVSVDETISLSTFLSSDFFHALILDGEFVVETKVSQGSTPREGGFAPIYDGIIIEQDDYTYSGKTFPGLNRPSIGAFTDQNINRNDIKISGKLQLRLEPTFLSSLSSGNLTVTLTIKQKINKLGKVDWRFTNDIKNQLNHEINPLSLTEIAPYINYIAYDKYDETAEDTTTGIGIQFYFEEIMGGFELALGCEDLGLDIAIFKELKKGENIIFGNTIAGTMWLAGDKPVSPPPFGNGNDPLEELDFKLELRPSGPNKDIISMDFGDAGVVPGEIEIEGKATFFQNWTEAEINMENVIKTGDVGEVFTGQIPAAGEDPIDLSMLGDYIPGFTFDTESVKAHIYLSGPHQAIGGDPNVLFTAVYGAGKTLDIGELEMKEGLVTISDDDFDSSGSYTKDHLPAGGNELQFLDIINTQPDNLVFKYEVELPETLIVTPDLFNNSGGTGTITSNITATIMVMLSLKLNGPGTISFPDMFEDAGDLFGRDSPGALLEGVNVQYVRVTLDFLDSFFTGGTLYIDKNKMLFPDGVSLNGQRITLDITNDSLKTMETNLIYPDVSLSFDQGGTIRVPKKMGIAGIKFEINGSVNVGEFFE